MRARAPACAIGVAIPSHQPNSLSLSLSSIFPRHLVLLPLKRSELEQEYQRHSHRLVAHTAPRLCALKERLENEMDQLDAMIAKLSKGAVYIRSEE